MVWIRTIACIAFLSFSPTVLAFDTIVAAIQNLTTVLNDTNVDIDKAIAIINKDWPIINGYVASLASLPDSIKIAVTAVNYWAPRLEICAYVVCGTAVVSAIIIALPKILEYCRSQTKHRPIDTFEQ